MLLNETNLVKMKVNMNHESITVVTNSYSSKGL